MNAPRFHPIWLLLLTFSILSVEGSRVLPFQVYLWPGGPNPNMEARLRAQASSTDYDSMVMVEYVPPTIQFSPTGGEEVETIRAAESRLSPVYRYEGEGPLFFFREIQSGEEVVRRVPLGSVVVPETIERALLLFMPNPTSPDTFRIYPIDNSLSKTKPGEACLHNVTQSEIGCLFNEEQVLLGPGEQKIVSIGASERITIVVRIAAQDDDGDWKQRHARQLSVQPDDSLTILIYNKPEKANAFRILKLENPKQ
ncbi:hypothetical protein [Puniceicoccus vermicola]|uniref:Uncharacterized protein n=1 Tax=Puniceicoccus vermicola TaxID=388746 RepID=A0A7X1E503_9BACT|nr:hypothetical protein [Puniceicoccus vermicola]MBC2602661.1 hypothetical protein [Puniceicoccus vermicola]